MAISIDNLAKEIVSAVSDYTEDVTTGIDKEADRTSKEMTKAIRDDSPRKSSKYAKGWTRKKISSGGEVSYVTYNKAKPWLAHILENGHVKRGGGRVAGKSHIRPAADRAITEFENRVRAIIQNGG